MIARYSTRYKQSLAKVPYNTKAGAELFKLIELDAHQTNADFLQFNDQRNCSAEPDICGFRLYSVLGQDMGKVGGTEFHRQRQEMVFGVAGEFEWICEDLLGNRSTHTIMPGAGVWMPPFILHTFTAQVSGSGLIVACNTIYDTSDPRTLDTFSAEQFNSLKQELATSK